MEESNQFHLFIVKSVHRSENQSVSVISGLHDKKNSLDGKFLRKQVILHIKEVYNIYPKSYNEQDDEDQEAENKEQV